MLQGFIDHIGQRAHVFSGQLFQLIDQILIQNERRSFHDFKELFPGATIEGIDLSRYGLDHAMEDAKPFLRLGNATNLPYKDKSFDLVVSINVVHNLPDSLCRRAIREMERVGRRHKYLQVDSFRNPEEKQNLELWQLTAELIYGTEQWERMFKEEGYTGDYFWTITE